MSWNSDRPFRRTSSTWMQNFWPGHMASVSANHPSTIKDFAELDGVNDTPEVKGVMLDMLVIFLWVNLCNS
jgi:hypothetical protein